MCLLHGSASSMQFAQSRLAIGAVGMRELIECFGCTESERERMVQDGAVGFCNLNNATKKKNESTKNR